MTGQHLTNYLVVVRVVNRLQAASLRSYGFFPNTGKRFFVPKHPYQLWGTLAFCSLVTGAVSPGVKWSDCEADHSSFV